ncbi:hypothetical protein [Curtobacterium sp. MCPF17_031]|uniref:phage terminase small subunit n=1 Tax=Curtobacterium sp. MCPF17_031 TaxID=2175653 RepID=UPI000DA99AEC|nr:hypothetical protein [Curtobacterium sp. MCPF17_031]PZE34988.1 hypothetical protein DEJ31_13005 [Curtobacterium sp. MCPF17_031]
MPGRGPLPSPVTQRERTTRARQSATAIVVDDGEVRGPELVGDFGPFTRNWYDTWRRSAQGQLFTSTDWLRVRMLAPLVEAYSRRPSAAAFSEIRLNEERLGATYVDRLRARIRIDPATDAVVTVLATDRFAALRERASRPVSSRPPEPELPLDEQHSPAPF